MVATGKLEFSVFQTIVFRILWTYEGWLFKTNGYSFKYLAQHCQVIRGKRQKSTYKYIF